MSEETVVEKEIIDEVQEEELSLEDRFAALEHQCYLSYLQLNALTQMLIDKEIIDRKELGSGMDAMHKDIESSINELQK